MFLDGRAHDVKLAQSVASNGAAKEHGQNWLKGEHLRRTNNVFATFCLFESYPGERVVHLRRSAAHLYGMRKELC